MDPYSDFRLEPAHYKTNTDPKHWFSANTVVLKAERINFCRGDWLIDDINPGPGRGGASFNNDGTAIYNNRDPSQTSHQQRMREMFYSVNLFDFHGLRQANSLFSTFKKYFWYKYIFTRFFK